MGEIKIMTQKLTCMLAKRKGTPAKHIRIRDGNNKNDVSRQIK